MSEKILVTGAAGFIGMHLCNSLLKDGYTVIGIDNINDYYDQKLKLDRLSVLDLYDNFQFKKIDLCNQSKLEDVFNDFKPMKVVNLAAQAGVRYSIQNPYAYLNSNLIGFLNLIELCRHKDVEGLIYASSSSVYGGNTKIPFSEVDRVDNPISLYAATKKSNELIANTYSHLYGMHTTGLRFFTVYGPWGRPDMAMYIFSSKIFNKEPIPVFNYGKMERDFTFIDDIIYGIKSSLHKNYPCEIFNLGNNRSENLMDMIKLIEKNLDIKAEYDFQKMQPGDVEKTFADISHSSNKLDYNPSTSIDEGVPIFIDWFKEYYNIK
tara:strand:+ start:1375 stop:2337 length:963 start_codon:yes stop_codon:yes gene_type:complete